MPCSAQRLLDIGDEIYGRLDADAETEKSVGDAGARALLRVHVVVRREARFRNERVHAAETWRVSKQLELPHEPLGGARSAREFERHHTAEPIKKCARDLVVRVRGQSRVVDALDLLSLGAPLREPQRVFVLPTNADVECLQAALEQPAAEWVRRLAPEHHLLSNLLDVRFGPTHD